jgi:hypothetical protein
MAKGEIPELSDFFKKTPVTDDERQAYHDRGWLTGNVISSIPEVDVPTVERSTIICFEPHLVAGLGLPPSKFLVTIMVYLNYELFHFNPNAISALGTFVMLCECWLGTTMDTSLFWYYYSPVRYSKVIYGRIGLSLCRHRRDEYIPASFQELLEGIAREVGPGRHGQTSVVGKQAHAPPPPVIIKDKWNESPMNSHLATLVKRVAELCEA